MRKDLKKLWDCVAPDSEAKKRMLGNISEFCSEDEVVQSIKGNNENSTMEREVDMLNLKRKDISARKRWSVITTQVIVYACIATVVIFAGRNISKNDADKEQESTSVAEQNQPGAKGNIENESAEQEETQAYKEEPSFTDHATEKDKLPICDSIVMEKIKFDGVYLEYSMVSKAEDSYIYTGEQQLIYKKVDNSWELLEPIEEKVVTDIAIKVPTNTKMYESIDIKADYGKLKPGTYKVVKGFGEKTNLLKDKLMKQEVIFEVK